MHRLEGACHCGNLRAEMQLQRPPADYSPRACDCDFCLKHGAAYISDPRGSLVLEVLDAKALASYRQGSKSAEFLLCKTCGVLLAVLYETGGELYATVNATALKPNVFGPAQAVSPKSIPPEARISRWQGVWFAQVSLIGAR